MMASILYERFSLAPNARLLSFVRREGVNDTVLLLPVTLVLVIPALRRLYPGSPPFGIYLGRSPAPRF